MKKQTKPEPNTSLTLDEWKQVVDAAAICFGKSTFTSTKLAHADQVVKEIFQQAQSTLDGISPLNEKTTTQIFDLLWTTPLSNVSSAYHNNLHHPASVFKRLHDGFSHLEEGPFERLVKRLSTPSTPGKHDVYFLNNSAGERIWVFKPQMPDNCVSGVDPKDQPKHEHVAWLLAREGGFPIPFTVLVELGGQIGSLQVYVEGIAGLPSLKRPARLAKQARRFDGIVTDSETDTYPSRYALQLHKLLLFDLLFANCDRTVQNFMVPNRLSAEEELGVMGIDHGDILTPSPTDELKIDYVYHLRHFAHPPLPELKELCSQVMLKRYQQILNKHAISKSAIRWMHIAGPFLHQAMSSQSTHPRMSFKDLSSHLAAERTALMACNKKQLQAHLESLLSLKN